MTSISSIQWQLAAARRVIARPDVTRVQLKKAVARRDALNAQLAIARNRAKAEAEDDES